MDKWPAAARLVAVAACGRPLTHSSYTTSSDTTTLPRLHVANAAGLTEPTREGCTTNCELR
jgi:hypothetical protein